MITVVLADDDERIRTALAVLLADEPDFEVVAQAADGAAAEDAAQRLLARLVLTDLRMPQGGPELVRRLVALPHRPVVVALSAHADVANWSAMVAAGCSGYLLKGDVATDLAPLLRRCLQGHLVIGVPGAAAAVRRVLG